LSGKTGKDSRIKQYIILAQVAILVNTTDNFNDCWVPFFALFKKYWFNFNWTIYLNTESASYSIEGLNIVSLRHNLKTPKVKPSWSECLLRALNFIPDEVVLYLQEDYFLHDFVMNDQINEFVRLISTTDIDCIHLTDQATPGPFHPSIYTNLLEIDNKAPYRISTQAALWKKDVMKQYIRKNESAWQFELYGTRRAHILKHKILNVDTSIYIKGKNEIIPYIFTGVIKGKWNKEVVDLFKRNGLEIDFSNRGFSEFEKIGNNNNSSFLISIFKKVLFEFNLLIFRICRN
jgi:hypothetical protein